MCKKWLYIYKVVQIFKKIVYFGEGELIGTGNGAMRVECGHVGLAAPFGVPAGNEALHL